MHQNRRPNASTPLAATLAALLPAVAVQAAEAPAAATQETLVVTGTRSDQPLLELAGNTGRVEGDTIDFVDADHISDTMFRFPGAWVSRGGSGQEHLTAIRSPVFTGPGACGAFLFAEDGISLRAAGFCNVNGLFEVNSEQAGAIEVVRGPGSALYGSNALHGVINVLSRAPAGHDYRASLEGSTHDLYRLKGTASRADAEQGYRLSVNVTEDGGWRDDSGYGQQKLTYRHDLYGPDQRIKFLLSGSNLNQDTAGYVPDYKDRDLIEQNQDPDAYRDAQSLRFSAQVDRRLDDRNRITVTPYLRYVDMEFFQHFLPQTPTEENGHHSLGVQTQWSHRTAADHRLIGGVDAEYTQGFLKETQELPTDGVFTQGKHYDFEVDAAVLAAFFHGDWALSPKTRLTTGLRAEYTHYDYDNRMIDGNTAADGTPCPSGPCRFSRPADRRDDFLDLSPKLGIVHRVAPTHALYASLARGLRAPQANELYRLQQGQSVTDLDSEQLDSLELGARGAGPRYGYDANVFYMKKREVIFQDSGRNNLTGGRTRHVGVELALNGELGGGFDAGLSATYARHTYDFDTTLVGGTTIESGDDIDTAPRVLASATLGWNARPGARVELEWIHMGSYYMDEANDHRYPGHDLFNLRGSVELGERVRLFGRVTNLADVRYAERADFAFDSERFFPGEPRAAFLGVEVSL